MKTGDFSRRAIVLGGTAATLMPQIGRAQGREIEGGIGGTGIVGVLTDFGSLIVGGQFVETTSQTVITDAFGPVAESALARGDSLTVEAAKRGDGTLVARRVHVTHPVVGRVSARSDRLAIVNSVQVVLPPQDRRPNIGDHIAVSGLWRGQQIIASRIAPARAGFDVLAGDMKRSLFGVQIGGTNIVGSRLTGEPNMSFATAVGTYNANENAFQAQSTTPGRFFGSAGPLTQLAVEGYLEPTSQAPGFRVSGLGHSFSRGLSLDPFANQRTLFTGAYVGTFAADAAVALPEDSNARRRLMRNLATRA